MPPGLAASTLQKCRRLDNFEWLSCPPDRRIAQKRLFQQSFDSGYFWNQSSAITVNNTQVYHIFY